MFLSVHLVLLELNYLLNVRKKELVHFILFIKKG